MEDIAAASGITKLIVYRHFDSKESLYRAVLQRTFDRLAEEFLTGIASSAEHGHGVGARSLLTVARDDPAGFGLLWRHAVREPAFAEYARDLRDQAVGATRLILQGRIDAGLHEWAAQTTFDFLVAATLNWVDHGDPTRDDEFVELTTAAVRIAVGTWAERG